MENFNRNVGEMGQEYSLYTGTEYISNWNQCANQNTMTSQQGMSQPKYKIIFYTFLCLFPIEYYQRF